MFVIVETHAFVTVGAPVIVSVGTLLLLHLLLLLHIWDHYLVTVGDSPAFIEVRASSLATVGDSPAFIEVRASSLATVGGSLAIVLSVEDPAFDAVGKMGKWGPLYYIL